MVLRCPNCGTTQAARGECEACHESQVRYFCTNHSPGLWLKGPTCPSCAEAKGRASERPSAPLDDVRLVPAARAVRLPPTPSAVAPVPVAKPSPEARIPAATPRAPEPSEPVWETAPAPMPPWQRLLAAALRARYLPTAPGGAARLPRRNVAGCLRRFVFVGFLFLLVAALVIVVLLRLLLNGVHSY